MRLLQNGAVAARTLQVKPDNLIDAPPQNGHLSAPELCLLTLTEHAAVTAPQLAGRRLPAAPQLGSPGLLGRICAVLDCSAHSRGAPASQIATRPSLSGARQSASPRWTPQAVQMEGVISLLSSGQQGQQLTEADLSLRRQHAESVTPHSLRWERHSAPQRATARLTCLLRAGINSPPGRRCALWRRGSAAHRPMGGRGTGSCLG